MNFTAALLSLDADVSFAPILPIKAAVYNGLFMANNRPWDNLPIDSHPTPDIVRPEHRGDLVDTLVVFAALRQRISQQQQQQQLGLQQDDGREPDGWHLVKVDFFDTDIVQEFYWNYYEYPTGLDMLMSDLGISLTVAFRSLCGQEPVAGVAVAA
ncbi:hypothetical protein SLS53_000483 [Cytospora paraplurivora]|uniref:Uncharacterized protein n=1 Tax=Cytospora paraplurivora TaxID=2898453 RepID=A0AAN9YMU2_9PEZI